MTEQKIPKRSTIRRIYALVVGRYGRRDEARAEFDRWMAQHDDRVRDRAFEMSDMDLLAAMSGFDAALSDGATPSQAMRIAFMTVREARVMHPSGPPSPPKEVGWFTQGQGHEVVVPDVEWNVRQHDGTLIDTDSNGEPFTEETANEEAPQYLGGEVVARRVSGEWESADD